jgi:hypothetical protein
VRFVSSFGSYGRVAEWNLTIGEQVSVQRELTRFIFPRVTVYNLFSAKSVQNSALTVTAPRSILLSKNALFSVLSEIHNSVTLDIGRLVETAIEVVLGVEIWTSIDIFQQGLR